MHIVLDGHNIHMYSGALDRLTEHDQSNVMQTCDYPLVHPMFRFESSFPQAFFL